MAGHADPTLVRRAIVHIAAADISMSLDNVWRYLARRCITGQCW